MRQRVLIAMAQMAQADLITADEPTTALDMTVQHHVLRTLHERCRQEGSAGPRHDYTRTLIDSLPTPGEFGAVAV